MTPLRESGGRGGICAPLSGRCLCLGGCVALWGKFYLQFHNFFATSTKRRKSNLLQHNTSQARWGPAICDIWLTIILLVPSNAIPSAAQWANGWCAQADKVDGWSGWVDHSQRSLRRQLATMCGHAHQSCMRKRDKSPTKTLSAY